MVVYLYIIDVYQKILQVILLNILGMFQIFVLFKLICQVESFFELVDYLMFRYISICSY